MSSRGFTLLETVVSLAIAAVLIFVVAAFSQNLSSFFSTVNKSKSLLETMEEVRFTLAARNQCTLNFANSLLTAPVTKISSFDKDGNVASPILQINQKLQGLSIQSISFQKTASLNSTLVQADLKVYFKDLTTNNPSAILERALPLLVQVQAGKIVNCWVQKDRNDVEVSQICLGVTDGALDTYDPVTKKCVLANGKWFEGTLTQASCPAGSSLPRVANSDYDCGYSPEVVDNAFEVANYQMTDGTIYDLAPPPVLMTLDAGSKQCHCDWATDLSSAVTQGVKCRILCVVPQ